MNFSKDGSQIAILEQNPEILKIFNAKDASQIGEDIHLSNPAD